LGFEEVLVSEKPGSPLVRDVIGWMREEIDSFPDGLRLKIVEASQRFQSTKGEIPSPD